MSHSSSSQDFRHNRLLQSSSSTIKTSSKPRLKKDNGLQSPTVRIAVSLLNVSQLQALPQSTKRPNSSSYLDMTDAYHEPHLSEPLTVRKWNDKTVRDDTHDLLNEPGGFIMNMSYHGQDAKPKEIKIHLGIKEKFPLSTNEPSPGFVLPGTITTTDDYAREIFRKIRSSPQLELLTAILEINDAMDKYEEKLLPEVSAEVLHRFIKTYPTNIAKFHVEMPGVSPAYLPEWKFLLDQQTSLKYLTCNFGVVMWIFYQYCVMRNSQTLVRVTLRRLQTYDFTSAEYFPFDWRMFSECENMEYLKVTCGYKNSRNCFFPNPPSSVFLHENLEELPDNEAFTELHLGNIWVDRRDVENFCSLRPNLKFCGPCTDLEYCDGDKAGTNGSGDRKLRGAVKLISVSKLDIDAEFSGSFTSTEQTSKPSREKQMAYLALTLFFVIIMAFTILFIIIYFRQWKTSQLQTI